MVIRRWILHCTTLRQFERLSNRIASAVTFQWSTTDYRFVYWTNAHENVSALLILAEIIDNQIKNIRSKVRSTLKDEGEVLLDDF